MTREERLKAIRALKKDDLVALVDDMFHTLAESEDETSDEEKIGHLKKFLEEAGIPFFVEQDWIIKVKVVFRQEPEQYTVEEWVTTAFETRFDSERCAFREDDSFREAFPKIEIEKVGILRNSIEDEK